MKSFRVKLRDAALSASTIYLHYALGLRLASHNFPSEIFSFILLAISIKPCHTQSMAAALFLDSAKNLSQIILAKLYGITRLAIHEVLLRQCASFGSKIYSQIALAKLCGIA